jgi:putative hydrolase of the HAD superfamily
MTDGYGFVLFDLGGVLVRLGGVTALQGLAELGSEGEVWRRWLTCPWVRDFERGLCSAGEFAAGVVADWGLPVSPEAFLESFEAWPEDLFDGTTKLVGAVRQRLRVACASNSNALHWERMTSLWQLGTMFDATFLSHELGVIKPDADFFEHVVSAIGEPPGRLVFLDDNEMNVAGASAAGLTAACVRGTDEARSALVELGVLPPS